MRCGFEWLSEWLPGREDPEALGERLTMAGIELDAMHPVSLPLEGIVVAHIEATVPHPNAGRLKLCEVNAGGGARLEIVCGAPNAAPGLYAPFAPHGARIGDTKIKRTRIRGVESQGMLCSASELGLGEDRAGLLDLGGGEPGADLVACLGLDDVIYHFDLTPNRADCFSVLGLAREAAALSGTALPERKQAVVVAAHDECFPTAVSEHAACPRYLSQVVTGINPSSQTPLQMRERLRRCGVRCVHPVVDVLNYVMLELGQPMHAFERARLTGGIDVRMAQAGESLRVLGGAATELDERTLVVADAAGPVAIAGVIGGEDSAVGAGTQDIVIECAFFAPSAILGRARAYGLQTESARRFERGVDPGLQARAMERATQLLTEITGGEPGPVVEIASDAHLPQPAAIHLRAAAVSRRLGLDIDGDFIVRALSSLGCELREDDGGWRCTPPGYRFDLCIEEDLVEEVGRLYGYDNIPEHVDRQIPERADRQIPEYPGYTKRRARDAHWCDLMVAAGYLEVVTYSFVDAAHLAPFAPGELLRLQNPISSEMAVMRPSLWLGLLQTLTHNLRRQRDRARIFEHGLCFSRHRGGLRQAPMLAGLVHGGVAPEQWDGGTRPCDFYDVKSDVENLLRGFGDKIAFRAGEHPVLHPGRTADVFIDEQRIGCVGELAPFLEKEWELPGPAFLFELDLDRIGLPPPQHYAPVSRFPAVRRDLALVVPAHVDAARVVECVRGLGLEHLAEIVIFDVFEGKGVESGSKSIALGLVFQDLHGTLEGDVSDGCVDAVVAAVGTELGGRLRT